MIDHICKGGDFENDSNWLDIDGYSIYTTCSKKYREYDYLRTMSFRLFLPN
jgi:hypothetical protein